MLQNDANSRPLANELYDLINKASHGCEMCKYCGDCCDIENDADSSSASASDGDLWAEDLDQEVTSPPITDEKAKFVLPASPESQDETSSRIISNDSIQTHKPRQTNDHRDGIYVESGDLGIMSSQSPPMITNMSPPAQLSVGAIETDQQAKTQTPTASIEPPTKFLFKGSEPSRMAQVSDHSPIMRSTETVVSNRVPDPLSQRPEIPSSHSRKAVQQIFRDDGSRCLQHWHIEI